MDKILSPSSALLFIENEEESCELEGQGIKTIFPTDILDIYSRLQVLLGIKWSGQTDALTEASNLIDEIYERCELQTEQKYRNALDKFRTN